MPSCKSTDPRPPYPATPISSLAISADDDDDFQTPLTQVVFSTVSSASQNSRKSSELSAHSRAAKKRKCSAPPVLGKENIPVVPVRNGGCNTTSSGKGPDLASGWVKVCENKGATPLDDSKISEIDFDCSLDSIEPSIVSCSSSVCEVGLKEDTVTGGISDSYGYDDTKGLKVDGGYLCNSIESILMKSRVDSEINGNGRGYNGASDEDIEDGGGLEALLNLCSEIEEEDNVSGVSFHQGEADDFNDGEVWVRCPLCGLDISDLSNENRQIHTNNCLDEREAQDQDLPLPDPNHEEESSAAQKDLDSSRLSPVLEWLQNLGLLRYRDAFIQEEIDWEALQCMTNEDLFSIGITALGPRKKLLHSLGELRKGTALAVEAACDSDANNWTTEQRINDSERHNDTLKGNGDETPKSSSNKLITDYFPGFASNTKNVCNNTTKGHGKGKKGSNAGHKPTTHKSNVTNKKLRDVPLWCCIPGTPFLVDSFRYIRGDCIHWFLTHFHMDHYQGLTRSFCRGKIYCSSITARLVNLKIGIPWERLQVLPLNQKINIDGVGVTCLDANHCPGAIIILFEPPNGKTVLHTGDFRFCEQMANSPILQSRQIQTLILDTTYCNPMYDFPKQDTVIQFVIEAIQAEAFNPRTLFLIGSYTIGKERLFLEVARILRKRIYVTAAKLRILKCLEYPEEDMQWFTLDEQESNIHVVPMWTLASFKRLKHMSNHYAGRFSLIVAFSPTGWSFGKGKKKSPGRRWQQGTIIRYEVPYSEHSSFTELQEFVKLVSPVDLIPSVNNDGPDSANAMISLLAS